MNAEPLETVVAFPYLGLTVDYNNCDWVVLYQNLRKVWWWWVMVGKVAKKTGATVRSWGIMHKAVVQLVF